MEIQRKAKVGKDTNVEGIGNNERMITKGEEDEVKDEEYS